MKKQLLKFLSALLVLCGFSLSADILDDLDKDIDSIEKSYWRAICGQQEDEAYFISIRNLLDRAQTKADLVQQSLIANKCTSKYGNINKEISLLRNRFRDYGMSPVRFFKIEIPDSFSNGFCIFRSFNFEDFLNRIFIVEKLSLEKHKKMFGSRDRYFLAVHFDFQTIFRECPVGKILLPEEHILIGYFHLTPWYLIPIFQSGEISFPE